MNVAGALNVNSNSYFMAYLTIGQSLTVDGDLNVQGQKNFQIDDPLDPANRYLYHSAVESSEMMNIYTGNVTTNEHGDATVQVPVWFEALNGDFRYQLTVIGQFAEAIVSNEIQGSKFKMPSQASAGSAAASSTARSGADLRGPVHTTPPTQNLMAPVLADIV